MIRQGFEVLEKNWKCEADSVDLIVAMKIHWCF